MQIIMHLHILHEFTNFLHVSIYNRYNTRLFYIIPHYVNFLEYYYHGMLHVVQLTSAVISVCIGSDLGAIVSLLIILRRQFTI